MASNEGIYLSEGLKDLDYRIDYLYELFEQMQLQTVDTALPGVDLLSFAQEAPSFSVIMKKKPPTKQAKAAKPAALNSDIRTLFFPERHPNHIPLGSVHFDPNILPLDIHATERENNTFSDLFGANSNPDEDLEMATIGPALEVEQNAANLNPNSDFYESSPYTSTSDTSCADEIIGLVYLVNPTAYEDPLHLREANIGIYIDSNHRGKGYSRQALEILLNRAFNELHLHRVQAILPHHVAKDRAICLFTTMRFSHEGTRRRAFWSQFEQQYMDVSYMGLLDTDWLMRDRRAQPAPRSVWDELFARHQREREELLNWESHLAPTTLRRTGSMATLRASTPNPGITSEYPSDHSQSGYSTDASESSNSSRRSFRTSRDKGKRKEVERLDDSPPPQQRQRSDSYVSDPESDIESIYSSASSHRSATPEGYSSTASWDAVDPPSSPSASSVASTPSFEAEWDDFDFDEAEMKGDSKMA